MIRGTLGDRAGLAPLKQALNAYALRHRVISGNIANAETPGYQPRRVEFESSMKQALATTRFVHPTVTDPRDIPVGDSSPDSVEPQVVSAPQTGKENGVDLQKEMVALVENQLSYRLAVRLLDMKYNQLHAAIRGSIR